MTSLGSKLSLASFYLILVIVNLMNSSLFFNLMTYYLKIVAALLPPFFSTTFLDILDADTYFYLI